MKWAEQSDFKRCDGLLLIDRTLGKAGASHACCVDLATAPVTL